MRIARALGALTLCALAFFAGAQPGGWETGTDGLKPVPALAARVTDLTSTLSVNDRSALETKLSNWERESGNQFAVLLVPTTQPEPIETYAIRVAEAWKIGRKGQDNGVLLVVAKDDRKLRLEVGYGFEGVLTDATSRRIIAETITPLFRQGQFAAGINAGVDRVIGVVGKGEPLQAPAQRSQGKRGGGIGLETLLILLFVVVPIMGGVLRRIFGKLFGATIGAGIVGAAAWFVAGSLLIAIAAALIGWLVLVFFGMGGGGGLVRPGRRGGWVGGPYVGGGGWGGGGGGGGGFSGGGGSFGGGGASGGW